MPKTINYQQLSQELDTILDKLQSGKVEIDEALELYKKGQQIIHQMEKFLNEAETTIKRLKNQASPIKE